MWKGDKVPKRAYLIAVPHMGRLKPICVLCRRFGGEGMQKSGKETRTEVVTKATRLSIPHFPTRFTFHWPFSDDQPPLRRFFCTVSTHPEALCTINSAFKTISLLKT
ncbi:hypothetical protein TNCT_640821 [Trichonephila clavata]|uniref:Uncharacterized protein n=1 Tax=Trichonephila clavata TaxID=2740835 RepID=A0A8X6M2I0_TRICU|nr:hypothetical protein TNCT_640821 [Trichonephila clavata]